MVQDYSISKCTRRCAISGRNLEPGESFVSVLVPQGEDVQRIDIAASAWQGPEASAIGWWRSRMPAASAKKLRPAPAGVLLDTLTELLDKPGKEALAYLLALLLVRRKILTEEEQLELRPDDAEQTVEPQFWPLMCPADGRQWSVPVIEIPSGQKQALQDELTGLLFTEM